MQCLLALSRNGMEKAEGSDLELCTQLYDGIPHSRQHRLVQQYV